MIESDIWRAIITTLSEGLAAQGLPLPVKQSYQPLKQGVDTLDTVYLHKISARRVGSQGRAHEYNSGNDNFDVTENYWVEGTYQLNAEINRDIDNSNSRTAYDVVELCSAILQGETARMRLLGFGVGILRISDIRNPYSVDDSDQFNQDSSFDFVLTYNQTLASTVPKAHPIAADINRV